MKTFAILIRGINVGGKNKVSMAVLKKCLEDQGFSNVSTYIASGNVIVQSSKQSSEIKSLVEKILAKNFVSDDTIIKVLVLTLAQLQAVVDNKPVGFGDQPDKYYCDTVFLIDTDVPTAMSVFNPREGVDKIWPGDGVIYSERLGSQRTKSRLSKIMGTPAYKSMTVRNWNTTTKLLSLLSKLNGSA